MKQTRNLNAHPPGADEEMSPDEGSPDKDCGSRPRGWFSIDNSFFYGGWAAQAGPSAALVYSAIVMHANRQTRQAWPSYNRLQSLTGLSRPTVCKGIKELARLGLIRVETRNGGRGHLYTILDISAGRCQTAAHPGLDDHRTQSPPTDPASDTRRQDAASGGHGFQQATPARSPGTAEMAQVVSQGGMAGGPGSKELLPEVVKYLNQNGKEILPKVVKNFASGGKETLPEQDSGNETHREQEPGTRHHQSSGGSDDDGLRVFFSSQSWIQEERKPTEKERARVRRVLALVLLKAIITDFQNAQRFVEGLADEKIDRLGALLLWLSRCRDDLGMRFRNPAGFVRSVVVAGRWDEPLDFEEMPAYWADFCWHVIDASRGLVSEQQCAYWLAERDLDADLALELRLAGFPFRAGEDDRAEPEEQASAREVEDDAGWCDDDIAW